MSSSALRGSFVPWPKYAGTKQLPNDYIDLNTLLTNKKPTPGVISLGNTAEFSDILNCSFSLSKENYVINTLFGGSHHH